MRHVLRAVALASLFLASLIIGFVGAAPANAADSDTCEDVVSGEGWQDKVEGNFEDGDPALTVTAPEGFLIDMYCVKTGSDQQGDGPVIVQVDPPAETVTIDHPTKEGVSHFMVHLIPVPSSPPTSETPSTETPPTETPTTDTPTIGTPGGPLLPPEGGPIQPPQGSPPSTLPSTGDQENLWALGALGLSLLLAGMTIVASRVRR
jgi:LPXTG-motif cell wall-anchored protein